MNFLGGWGRGDSFRLGLGLGLRLGLGLGEEEIEVWWKWGLLKTRVLLRFTKKKSNVVVVVTINGLDCVILRLP